MGYYINTNSKGEVLNARNKAHQLILDGAKPIEQVVYQPNLVCVVENGPFDAAAFCFSENEFTQFNNPYDSRPKHWLIYEHAEELSGYNK